MARRRAAGGFNTASSLIQMYIQDQMQRERAAFEDQLAGKRQREDDVRNFILQSAPRVAGGEFRPEAFSPEMSQSMGAFYDPTKLAPTIDQRVGSAITPFLAKNQYQDIPDEQGVLEALKAAGISDVEHPSVVGGLNAIKARKESLKPFIPSKAVPQYDPTSGAERTSYVPENELAGMTVQTSPTPQQKGANTLTETLSGELSPQMTQAKVGATNTFNRGTMGSEAAKAGAVAGAQTGARLAQEWKPEMVLNRYNEAKQLAELEVAKRGDIARAENLQASGMASTTAALMLARAKAANERVPDAGLVGRITTGASSFMGTDLEARDMDDLADGGGIALAQLLGNKGAVSEADKQAGMAYFPLSHQPKALRDRKLARLEQLISIAPRVAATLPPTATPLERFQAVETILNQMEQSQGIAPPTTPPQVNIREF